MNETELLKPVLDKGEEIIKWYKPHRFRAYIDLIFTIIILVLFLGGLTIGVFIQEGFMLSWLLMYIFVVVLVTTIQAILISLWYKKTIYVITNKRIIVRTGYIGVDYHELDYDTIGAITVIVDWKDKFVKKNTGSISFGSMASPMIGLSGFTFKHITDPYAVNREIKAIMDENKQKSDHEN